MNDLRKRISISVLGVLVIGMIATLVPDGSSTFAAPASVSIAKAVDANGDGIYEDNGISVKKGDQLSYQVVASSPAGSYNPDVSISDTVPTGTTYVTGSTRDETGSIPDVASASVLQAGYSLGQMGGGRFAQTGWDGSASTTVVGPSENVATTSGYISADPALTRTNTSISLTKNNSFSQDTTFSSLGNDQQIDSVIPPTAAVGWGVTLSDGNYVSAWYESIAPVLKFRVYAPDGSFVTPEITIASALYLSWIAIARTPNGFAIAWIEGTAPVFGTTPGTTTLKVQKFTSAGVSLLSPATVAIGTCFVAVPCDELALTSTGIAVDGSGNVFLAYISFHRPVSVNGSDYYLAGWNTSGALFAPFVVNDTVSFSNYAGVAVNEMGQVGVAWLQDDGVSPYSGLSAEVYTSTGLPINGTTDVNMTPTDFAHRVGGLSVAALRNGDFVVAWGRFPIVGTIKRVSFDILHPDESFRGVITDIDTQTTVAALPKVEQNPDTGDIVMAWIAGSPAAIYGKVYDESLVEIVPVTQLSAVTTDISTLENISFSPSRKLLVTYSRIGGGAFHHRAIVYDVPRYAPTGSLTSRIYDAGKDVSWLSPSFSEQHPAGTSVLLEARTGSSFSIDGTWSSFTPIAAGGVFPSSLQGRRYIQYRVTLNSDGGATPIVDDVGFVSTAESRQLFFDVVVAINEQATITNTANVLSDGVANVSNTTSNPIAVTVEEEKIEPPPPIISPPPVTPPVQKKSSWLAATLAVIGAGLISFAAPLLFGIYTLGAVGIYLLYLFTEPLRALIGRKKKVWGVVYNALSKKPVDLAIIRLFDQENRLIKTRISDRTGRYQFIVDKENQYHITVTKAGYGFPSQLLHRVPKDAAFDHLYYGETFTSNGDEPIIPNIPLDPPVKDGALDVFLKRKIQILLSHAISLIGLGVALVTAIQVRTVLTWVLVFVHLALYLIFNRLASDKRPKPWGVISDSATVQPLNHTIGRIFDKQYNRLLDMTESDGRGRYAFLADKNLFYATFEHATHKPKTSDIIDLTTHEEGGIINLDIPLEPEHGSSP